MGTVNAPWTDEQIEQALALWADGHSASQIGARLGKTRNAVIGRVHRASLKRGMTIARSKVQTGRKARGVPVYRGGVPSMPVIKPLPAKRTHQRNPRAMRHPIPVIDMPVTASGSVGVGVLETIGCKWPTGFDAKIIGLHLFCNAARPIDKSYCDVHNALSWRPVLKLTRENRP